MKTVMMRLVSPNGIHCTRSSRSLHAIPTSPVLKRRHIGLMMAGSGFGVFNRPLRVSAAQSSGIEKVLENGEWPSEFPFGPEAFARYDEENDAVFYSFPRFVTHIDDNAIQSLTDYYAQTFPKGGGDDVALLDICSSWISHYPKEYKAGRISGLGMNREELEKNSILTDYVVADLNTKPAFDFPDNTFDVVTNCVSVDYLTKPLEVFKEVHRVLKPGGVFINSFSNRCFPTKAIAIWTQTGDADHVYIVGSYYHYSVKGGWSAPVAKDITKKPLFGYTDPMYVVQATKTVGSV